MKSILRATALLVVFFCTFVFFSVPFTATAKTGSTVKRQVIFLPFEIQIPGSYNYLRNSLASMLASRLASRADIAATAQGIPSEKMARALQSGDFALFSQQLRQSGADYLIMGSLTPKGQNFELTSYVFSNNSGQAPKKFEQSLNVVENAMTAIDDLAWDISGAVFGKPRPETAASDYKQTSGTVAFQTAHPERAYREGLFSGAVSGLEAGGQFELAASYRSKSIPADLMDINTGDLDGDGTDEIILLTNSSLLLYHQENGQFRQIAALPLPSYLRYLSVTVGDLNNNGLQEIYVSASNDDRPDSSGFEWNGKKFLSLFQHVGYYLRTLNVPDQPLMLIGQKPQIDQIAGGALYQMSLDQQYGVKKAKQLNLPEGINVFDFTLADINSDGTLETIAINNSNRLQVFDSAGTLLWTSAEIYGASNNFFGTLTSSANAVDTDKTPGQAKESAYIKTRIVIADLDFDGTNDILIGRNRLETVRFVPNLRYFDGSSLSALKWQDGTLKPLWETKKIPGYITNYQVSPQKKTNNQYQILFAEVENSYPFVFWGTAATVLNSYTLQVNALVK
jgi:hypothetical protein